MVRQIEGDGRRLPALLAAALQSEADGVGMGDIALERLGDGGLKFGGAVALQQPGQGCGDGAEIAAVCRGTGEQSLACGRRMKEQSADR